MILRPASLWAPAQVVGPPPVVESAATTSGWDCRMDAALEMALGASKPSSSGASTFTSGCNSFIAAVKLSDTMFSVVLNEPCVIATLPLPPMALPMARAASLAYAAGSQLMMPVAPGTEPSVTGKCGRMTGTPALPARSMKGFHAGLPVQIARPATSPLASACSASAIVPAKSHASVPMISNW